MVPPSSDGRSDKSPFNWTGKCLKSAPKGFSPGPGGWAYDNLFFEAVFAQAPLLGEIAEVLMGARLTVLAKPDGSVRGIATGVSMRSWWPDLRNNSRKSWRRNARDFNMHCRRGLTAEGSHRQRPFRHYFQCGWNRRPRGWNGCWWHADCCFLCVSCMQHFRATVCGMTMGKARRDASKESKRPFDAVAFLHWHTGRLGRSISGEQLCALLDDVYVLCLVKQFFGD